MAIKCEDNSIEMPCGDCLPSPPDKPLPFLFLAYTSSDNEGGQNITYPGSLFVTHPSNPGKVGISTGFYGLPSYTAATNSAGFTVGRNFAQTLPIVIDPPPGFPGAGLVQATATMSVDVIGNVTVIMTNNGAGYPSTTPTAINYSFGNQFTKIVVKESNATDLGSPTAILSYPLPYYPNITLSSVKVIPQLCGYIENTLAGGSPIIINGKFYKNGIQIGQTMVKQITTEGKHKIVHYCDITSFLFTDKLSYELTCADTELVNFTGHIIFYIQYT